MRPEDVLPHRAPFLLLDEITDVVPGRSAMGLWKLTGEEAFFSGHFPDRPTLPGVLMVESLAQLGAFALLADPRFHGRLPLFGGIDRARFRRQVNPGDTLELAMTLGRVSSKAGRGSGQARVGGAPACEAEVFFVMVDG